jgi:serine/threonine-protein kinase HipA
MRALDVFLEGVTWPVGRLTSHDDGSTGFRYLRADLPYPMSQSLPVRDAPYGDASTRAFFANLLFENAQRDQVMQRHGLAYGDTVGLLFHLGRDCAGAISRLLCVFGLVDR